MSLFARADLACISIPATSGGCGTTHSRPVVKGAPVKVWKLDCPPCESVLRGDGKQHKLIYETDPKTGQVLRQSRVPDGSDQWSSTPDTIPFTPDQEKTHHVRIERGEQQLRALESIATLAKAGIDFRTRPDVLFFLRENQLPEDVLQGTVVCVNDHPNPPGAKFCNECGASMAARAAIASSDGDEDLETGPEALDLSRVHVQSLRKMCREKGLLDRGSKDVLIGRLQQAA